MSNHTDDEYTPVLSEEERQARRAARIAARKKKDHDRRIRRFRQLLPFAVIGIALVAALAAWSGSHQDSDDRHKEKPSAEDVSGTSVLPSNTPHMPAAATSETVELSDDLPSKHAVVIDLQTNTILAEKDADAVIAPASMTKLLTLLVAAENLTEADLEQPFTMTLDIADYAFLNDCSVVGLMVNETVPVRELLYGTILPSGADAAVGLARYVAGSHEKFVELMNEKLEELGLSESAHFTNCVGLYDEAHHCTVKDMAVIMQAAMENELCREVLKSRTYQTIPTEDHPNGQVLSNWFLRRIEDKDTGDIRVIGAKTGYVAESGNCAVSCGQDADGNLYVVVTANGFSSWCAIYDHVELYHRFCN